MSRVTKQMMLEKGDRVAVTMSKARKYGTVVAEGRDKCSWLVLIDGNRQTKAIHRDRLELLTPQQLAFHWRK